MRKPGFEDEGLTLLEWNRRLNRTHSQDDLLRHSNPLVRRLEGRRRRVLFRFVERAVSDSGRRGAEAVFLDVGCGTAILEGFHREGGGRWIHVDIDPDLLHRVREARSLRSGGESIEAVAADLLQLPMRSNSVDVLLASAVLEHIPVPEDALGEMMRVLRPGGRLVLSVPYDRLVLMAKGAIRGLGLGRLFPGIHLGLAPGHLHVFGLRQLRRDLARSGRRERYFYDPLCFCVFATVLKKESLER